MTTTPANDPTVNYKALVAQGYDACAEAYAQARHGEVTPEFHWLLQHLPTGASVLDIGCGAGVPIAQMLAEQFRVTGVDISAAQLALAQTYVPNGTFIHGDIMAQNFAPDTFEGILMFYALFHLPREEHRELLSRIYRWLKPSGYLLFTVAREAEAAYTEPDFFGVTMYWSNYGLADYQRILTESGFRLLKQVDIGHGYNNPENLPESHPLIFAQVEK